MSGKKAQRTKGNTQASSSSRSAIFLQNEGQTGLISFSGLGTNTPLFGDVNAVDAELRLLLRKMAKKDTITKLKAVQEFTLLCKEKDGEAIKNMLSFWPRMYNKLSLDFDHRVRESTQQAHYQLTTKAGRNLAPHLKQIIVCWLMSQFDTHLPAANNAKVSFDEVFQEKKRKEVLLFCKTEILQACEKNILRETADTLSDPKAVPLEERMAKYNRFISSTFQLLKYLLQNLQANDNDDVLKENLAVLFADKKFWKFCKHDSPMIRSAFFTVLLTFCEHLHTQMGGLLQHLAPTILTNVDEQDALVTKALWDVILYCLATYKDIWQHVNTRKAVWPKLWKLLNAGCYGNINIVYPNLLPFISNISPEVAGEGTGFYSEFFSHVADIVVLKQKVLSESDIKLVMHTYMECIRCLLVKNKDKELCDFIIWNMISDLLHNIFHSTDEHHEKYRTVFMTELHLLLNFVQKELGRKNIVSNEVVTNKETVDEYRTLYTDLWKVISAVIFIKSDGIAKFKIIEADVVIEDDVDSQSNFYNSLMDLLTHCIGNLYSTKTETDTALQLQDEPSFVFLQDVVKCFVYETFSEEKFDIGEQIFSLISLTYNIDLIRLLCIEKLRLENNTMSLDNVSDLEVSRTFVNSIVVPFLDAKVTYEKKVFEVTVGVVSVLKENDKELYLNSLFQETLFSDEITLAMLVELFKYSDSEYVLRWWKSDFIEKQILRFCTLTTNEDYEEAVDTKWEFLKNYVNIIRDTPDKLSIYHNKLFTLIKYCIKKEQTTNETINAVLSTFTSLCIPSLEITKQFEDTLFTILRLHVTVTDKEYGYDALDKGFNALICNDSMEYFETFVKELVTFVKECSLNKLYSSNLCAVICRLLTHTPTSELGDITFCNIMMNRLIDSQQEMNPQDARYSDTIKFYAEFLKVLVEIDLATLKICWDKKIGYLALQSLMVAECENDDVTLQNINIFIKLCEFAHFDMVDDSVQRCLQGDIGTGVVKRLLQILVNNNQLTETITDHIMLQASPQKHNYNSTICETYCMIVSILNDISTVRALVEMFVDELTNNVELTNDKTVFGQFINILSTVINKWFTILTTMECDKDDYYDIIHIVVKNIVAWKDEHSDMMLFSSLLSECEPCVVTININLMLFLHQSTVTAMEVFKGEMWDFLLCSMISWLQTCEESVEYFEDLELCQQFMHAAFKLFNVVASMFESCATQEDSSASNNVSPCIYVKDASPCNLSACPSSPPSLSDDNVSEWKELFLPTASTSLLHIYTKVVIAADSKHVEFERTMSSCIRHVPPFTIHDFVCSGHEGEAEQQKALEKFYDKCCQMMVSGRWWIKIGSYQLLTGLGESIEGKLCFMTQIEDEDHEGMRSFPTPLVKAMESSRDQTLTTLSSEEVSINHPLKALEKEDGKSYLLTYLLSWQLMLQIFKMADPGNRALFANYFHNNSDVHDLITCLFCIMPHTVNMEKTKKINLTKFTFPEIRQIAFHLLTTAMESIPALIRNWFNNYVNRVDTETVNRFVSNFISPLLLRKEFKNLNETSKEFNNMVVKTRSSAREIVAIYTVDEVSMELVVQLGQNHPLSPVTVTCGKRIGVSNDLWRKWMLQLNTFLSFQNGSILDGLALWKKNVDKRFEGVEECMVCFSVLHGSNYSLPTTACKTCKKKFHPACLYKWFNTSGKCTCPLCRNIF